MKCPLCNNDMQIASSFYKNMETGDGKSGVFSVADLMCTDMNCPNGKKKMPVMRETRAIENRAETQGAVTCCGEPIFYQNDDGGYWVPEGIEAEMSADGKTILAVCPVCGTKHTAELKIKEQTTE